MFKKLRRRFTLLTMLVISSFIGLLFSGIYVMMYIDMQWAVEQTITAMLDGRGVIQGEAPAGQNPLPNLDGRHVFPGKGFEPREYTGFALLVQPGGEHYDVVSSGPFWSADNIDVDAVLREAVDGAAAGGTVYVDGYAWTYRWEGNAAEGGRVAFVEVSRVRNGLRALLLFFALTAAALLGFIWLVSRWFARRSVRPIEQAYEAQRRFVQDASHELKTPVAVFKTNLELLASHGEHTVASQQAWVNNLRTETAHMEHLTASLLALAQTEADTPRAETGALCLDEVARGAVLPMEAAMYERRLRLETDMEEGVWVRAPRTDMERLVRILLDNAMRYTDEGGTVRIALRRAKKTAVLEMSNSGPGIPPEAIGSIFKRFYRADSSRSRQSGGYGLGLAIAEGIVRRCGGGIRAESEPGVLTVFTVTLPFSN